MRGGGGGRSSYEENSNEDSDKERGRFPERFGYLENSDDSDEYSKRHHVINSKCKKKIKKFQFQIN